MARPKTISFNRKEAKEKVLKTKIGKTTRKRMIIFSILFLVSLFGNEITIAILKTLNIEITILIKNLSIKVLR